MKNVEEFVNYKKRGAGETLGDPRGGVLDGKVPLEAFRESAIARRNSPEPGVPKPDPYSEERVTGAETRFPTKNMRFPKRVSSSKSTWWRIAIGVGVFSLVGLLVTGSDQTKRRRSL